MKQLLKSISFIITLTAALSLIASAATTLISPVKIHFLTFMGFLFPILWVLNLGLFLLHIIRKSPRLLIPLIALALTWTQWTNVFQVWGSQHIPEDIKQPVKIMTYNSRMFNYYNWSNLPNTPNAIFEFISDENPDILCIQEYYSAPGKEGYTANEIRARLKTFGYTHVEYRNKNGRNSGYGIATYSKFPIVNKGKLPFEKSKNMSIYNDININGEIIRLFNNHLESIGFMEHDFNVIDSLRFEMDEKQTKGLKQIVGKMTRAFRQRSNQAETLSQHIENSPYPVIVCGDFNDTPISYVYREMRGDLKDAFCESGSGMSGTYNGRLPSLRIDYLFHDADFQSYNYTRHKINYSDHFPISATIEVSSK